jgi:hypothetical protein
MNQFDEYSKQVVEVKQNSSAARQVGDRGTIMTSDNPINGLSGSLHDTDHRHPGKAVGQD